MKHTNPIPFKSLILDRNTCQGFSQEKSKKINEPKGEMNLITNRVLPFLQASLPLLFLLFFSFNCPKMGWRKWKVQPFYNLYRPINLSYMLGLNLGYVRLNHFN